MKKLILVAEDEWSTLELLRFKLSKRGFQVVTAKNEKEFIAQALKQKPELVILDMWLSGKMGTELYETLLAFGFDPKVPVIFITELLEDLPPTPVMPGAKFALYGKPLNFEELMSGIQCILESKVVTNVG